MYRPSLVAAPTIKPVTLDEVKAHCRATDFTDDDATLTALIAAATSYLDGWTGILGRALCEQTWRQDFDEFRHCLRLPLYPVISIASVKYSDPDGAEQTIDASNYSLKSDDRSAYIEFITDYCFPSLNTASAAVFVSYVAGYADEGTETKTSTAPASIKHAILLLVSHWYQNRDAVVVGDQAAELPMAVTALIAPFRRIRF